MIVSHKHRYVFVELPLTGSTAIAKELVECYAGERFLTKHSTYQDFLRVADASWRSYFVFSGIRNPLDQAVSQYLKLMSDHKTRFSRMSDGTAGRRRSLHFTALRWLQLRKFRFVKYDSASFPAFLLKFYWLPYSNWSVLSHKKFDSITRFESLAEDFARTLRAIGIEPVRPLPERNRTKGKAEWTAYYPDERVREFAVRVFGPFMQYWDYEFPVEWGKRSPSAGDVAKYRLITGLRRLYWKYVRYAF